MPDQPDPHELRVRPASEAEQVPVFNCHVFVRRTSSGVAARVANLPGIAVEAEDQRQAMQRILPLFKATVAELMKDGPIAWIEDCTPNEDEQELLIPVHL